jgi:hypothetical protein
MSILLVEDEHLTIEKYQLLWTLLAKMAMRACWQTPVFSCLLNHFPGISVIMFVNSGTCLPFLSSTAYVPQSA